MSENMEYCGYVADVLNTLKNENYSEHEYKEIVERMDKQYNNIDLALQRKGWKYIIKHFAPEIKRGVNVYFTTIIDGWSSAMSVKNDDGTYTVTFAFINKLDTPDKDYKKYLVANYVKNRYTFRNIVSTSYNNSIIVANNRNYMMFPKHHRVHMSPVLDFMDTFNYPEFELIQEPVETPEAYFKDPYTKYKRIREEFKEKYGVVDKDIRFYNLNTFSAFVVRSDENFFTVTFSFLNPKDMYYLRNICNEGDAKHVTRYCVLRNAMVGKYTYNVADATNSMNAVVTAYNKHRLDFPSYYHDVKLHVYVNVYVNED